MLLLLLVVAWSPPPPLLSPLVSPAQGKDCMVDYVVYNEVDAALVKVALKGMCGKEEGLVKDAARAPLLDWGANR